ncbi:hypothetical protein SNE40_020739 [Patella caerulea]|uniref:Splicing factor YJU2 n=1 Tax=Patella caerulea TaxID=87958 RepID=A0AAN8J5F7_PATCE
MSERKVLNKYYPPSFDPSKIPKVKGPKNRTFSIRIMAPFNMRCNTCGVYIYKGKKFNSRKENVDDEDYYGLRIFRFYIKCPCCVSEIAFKTDLKNTDYTLEAGATRLFEAEKLAQQMAEKERQAQEAEDMNPMKVLENRTKASRNEIEQLDTLEELREMNTRNAAVDHESMIKLHTAYEEMLTKLQDEEDENIVQSIFGSKDDNFVKRLADSDSEEEIEEPPRKKMAVIEKPTDLLAEESKEKEPKKLESWQKSVGVMGINQSKKGLAGLIVKKKPKVEATQTSVQSETKTVNGSLPAASNQSIPVIQKTSFNSKPLSDDTASIKPVRQSDSKAVISGLSMLGDYSDSSGDSD